MENKKTIKLLDKIIADTHRDETRYSTLTDSLKELRELVVEDDLPVLAKVLRLTYQHLESFEDFFIPIPEDEPLDESQEKEDVKGIESLQYLLNLIKHHENKFNYEEIKQYIHYLEVFAEDD